ncbi:MAG: TetR/AcrR family transcriptional regulator [Acidimicrobiales bacterium]
MNALEMLTRAFSTGQHREPDDDDDAGATTAKRILDAARRRLELFGIQRTTMEDIARRSGVSRVTVYRHFPTKEALLEAVLLREVRRFLVELGTLIETLDSDEDRIVEGYAFVVRTLREHKLLQRLLHGEPELFLPQLTTEAGPMIAVARDLIVDYLVSHAPAKLSREEAAVAAEIGIRLTLSLVLTPETAIDLDDTEAVRRIVRRLPAWAIGNVG